MNRSMRKTTFRELSGSFGRYFAILAITALGVGFFSGLKVSKEAMLSAGDKYLKDHDMYDLMFISSLGFEESDAEAFKNMPETEYAEGAYRADAIVDDGSREFVARFHSLTENIDTLCLSAGRTASKAGEIVADDRHYSADSIGRIITLSP